MFGPVSFFNASVRARSKKMNKETGKEDNIKQNGYVRDKK